MHGLLGECHTTKEPTTKKTTSKSDNYCGCGLIKDEKMIECASGRKCGGWVHFSCAGMDFDDDDEDKSEPYICKWCRADGVNLNEKKKETKVEKTKKEEEHVITRARTRQKKDGIGYIKMHLVLCLADSSYYGGYKREISDDDEPKRKTRKRGNSVFY